MLLLDNAENIILAHDQVLFAVDVYLTAGIFSKQDSIIYLEVEWSDFAIIIQFPLADRDHFSFLRFLFGGVGNDDRTRGSRRARGAIGNLFFGAQYHRYDLRAGKTPATLVWFRRAPSLR